MGGEDCESSRIHFFPSRNSGGETGLDVSIFQVESSHPFGPLSRIFSETRLESLDFVKVDVEGGGEMSVVPALFPAVSAGKIRTLMLDSHASILERNRVDPADLQGMLTSRGVSPRDGESKRFVSNVLSDERG